MPKESQKFVLPIQNCHDNEIAGGKAINLSHLINAGFPVPGGFVVTTAAFKHALNEKSDMPKEVAEQIKKAYKDIGSPTVAVRSSATAEDMADASMAGQYETYLDINGEKDVVDSVLKCWQSIDTPRTRTYLQEHGIKMEDVAMAVVIQLLVPADIAGVMFTANPRTGHRHEMLIEASWGLGEAVVSGIVQPDTLTIDRATGGLKEANIQQKLVWIEPGSHEERPVPEEKQDVPCITSEQVQDLWHLGLKVADHFGSAQDLEWGIHDDKLYLLQSRNITTLEDAEIYEKALEDTRAKLREEIADHHGPWVKHNIGETLPHPTPLTWSLIKRFMSGDGGYGNMYKTVGFEPTEQACQNGFLELIGGRVYMDLSVSSEMFFDNFPFEYDLELMRSNPDACQGPPTIPSGTMGEKVQAGKKLVAVNAKMLELSADFDKQLAEKIIPEFVAYVKEEKDKDLSKQSNEELIELWQEREKKVLDEFAPQSLLPSLFGAMALETLKAFAAENFWDDDPEELINLLATGPEPDKTVMSNEDLQRLAKGEMKLDEWLELYGHRAPEEFDIASPRWREKPDSLKQMAEHIKDGHSPLDMHKKRHEEANQKIANLAKSMKEADLAELKSHLDMAHRYLAYRENGKYYLMLGYDLLRDVAMEFGRRLNVAEDVFLMSFEEVKDALLTGFAPLHLIKERRNLRGAQKRMTLPQVITAEDIDDLGMPPELEGKNRISAFSISSGSGSGPAKIVYSPEEAGDLGTEYILVCPSTDPSWTPLFVNATGLILECGGTLSHGAVVAREMGIPAVVIPNATKIFEDNEQISVDGHNGVVIKTSEEETVAEVPDPLNTHVVPELVPPVPGNLERKTGLICCIGLAVWGIFLILTYLVFEPAVIEKPVLRILDIFLLPMVAAIGKPLTVVFFSTFVAVSCMVLQKFLTDSKRLREAKKRASLLQKEAKKLPEDSPRCRKLVSLAKPVQNRITMAAFVPLAVILGPMMLSFIWLSMRVDTGARNAKVDSPIVISALVDADFAGQASLQLPAGFKLDEATPKSQKITNYKPYLEKYYQKIKNDKPSLAGRHWAEKIAVMEAYDKHVADLESFLANGKLPPQKIGWKVYPPEGKSGRWNLQVKAGSEELSFPIVLGEGYEPELKEPVEEIGRKGKVKTKMAQIARAETEALPVTEVQLTYQESLAKGEGTFWKPLDWFEPPMDRAPSTFEMLFSPWLILYLLVYIPMMFIAKFFLKVP